MNNRTVAQRFAEGKTTGRGSNLFIDGDTIYSYGYHFAICTRFNGYYFFTEDNYSISTSRHKSYVRDALDSQRNLIVWSPNGRVPTLLQCEVERSMALSERNHKRVGKRPYNDLSNLIMRIDQTMSILQGADITQALVAIAGRTL